MNSTVLGILVVVGIMAVLYGIRYVVSLAANKGQDAINNAISRRQTQAHPPQTENLADRFKTNGPGTKQ